MINFADFKEDIDFTTEDGYKKVMALLNAMEENPLASSLSKLFGLNLKELKDVITNCYINSSDKEEQNSNNTECTDNCCCDENCDCDCDDNKDDYDDDEEFDNYESDYQELLSESQLDEVSSLVSEFVGDMIVNEMIDEDEEEYIKYLLTEFAAFLLLK